MSRTRRRSGRLALFRSLGPGLITGAADDDPSGIGTYSQVGASLRFDLLWTAVLSLPLTIAVIELAARYGLVTDRGLADVVKRRFPRAIYPVVLLVVAANTFNVGADLGSMAASLRLLVPVPQLAGVVVFAILITALEVRIPYERYAKVLRWLVLSLAAYFIVLFSVHVPWGNVARRTFIPRVSGDRKHLAALIAIFGTTISPYLFFWQAAEEVEEQGGEGATKTAVRRMRADVTIGVAAGVAVMFAILVATAVTLGTKGGDVQTADQAARALRPAAGQFASLIFTLGIVGTGLLAIPTLVGSSAYAVTDTLAWEGGLSKSLRQAPTFYGVIIVGMAVGAALNLTGVGPIRALFLAALFNGLAAPPILILMAVAARGPELGRWRSHWVSTVVVSAAALIMTLLPAWYLFRSW